MKELRKSTLDLRSLFHNTMAGLLTLSPGVSDAFPTNSAVALCLNPLRSGLQQRDCPGFPPDSLLIAIRRTACVIFFVRDYKDMQIKMTDKQKNKIFYLAFCKSVNIVIYSNQYCVISICCYCFSIFSISFSFIFFSRSLAKMKSVSFLFVEPMMSALFPCHSFLPW